MLAWGFPWPLLPVPSLSLSVVTACAVCPSGGGGVSLCLHLSYPCLSSAFPSNFSFRDSPDKEAGTPNFSMCGDLATPSRL